MKTIQIFSNFIPKVVEVSEKDIRLENHLRNAAVSKE
jgi:hypothetical protein